MGEGPGFPEGDPLGNSGLKEALLKSKRVSIVGTGSILGPF